MCSSDLGEGALCPPPLCVWLRPIFHFRNYLPRSKVLRIYNCTDFTILEITSGSISYPFGHEFTFYDSVVENPYLCSSISCTTEKKKKNVVGPIEASVGGLLFLLLAAAAIFWIITKINHGKGKTNTTFTKQG